MNYISSNETAKRWGVSKRRVVKLAADGRIPGAKLWGMNWMIPEGATKPIDGRTKAHQSAKQAANQVEAFRFPILVNYDETDYLPPLSFEEKQLRKAQLAYYAYRLDEAKNLLLPLAESCNNRYVRIAALYHLCTLAESDEDMGKHKHFSDQLNRLLSEDFPYKQDMLLFKLRLEQIHGHYKSLIHELHINPKCMYHPSSEPYAAVLSAFCIAGGNFSILSNLRFDIYELLCKELEATGHFCEAQVLHFSLLEIYQMQAKREMMEYHMRKGLEIAEKHELYMLAAINSFYYPDIIKQVLSEFPKDFAATITSLGIDAREKYIRFESKRHEASYISLLSDKDYIYITYAVNGYSNKETSRMLSISEKTVSLKYNSIYDKLGVKSKHELVEFVTQSLLSSYC